MIYRERKFKKLPFKFAFSFNLLLKRLKFILIHFEKKGSGLLLIRWCGQYDGNNFEHMEANMIMNRVSELDQGGWDWNPCCGSCWMLLGSTAPQSFLSPQDRDSEKRENLMCAVLFNERTGDINLMQKCKYFQTLSEENKKEYAQHVWSFFCLLQQAAGVAGAVHIFSLKRNCFFKIKKGSKIQQKLAGIVFVSFLKSMPNVWQWESCLLYWDWRTEMASWSLGCRASLEGLRDVLVKDLWTGKVECLLKCGCNPTANFRWQPVGCFFF